MKLSTVVILAGHPTLTRTFQAALHTCHDQLECTRCHHLQPSLETCRVLLILRGRFVILAGRLLGSGSCITVVTQPKSIHHCFSCLYACLLVWSRHIRCVYLPKVFQPYWAATSWIFFGTSLQQTSNYWPGTFSRLPFTGFVTYTVCTPSILAP